MNYLKQFMPALFTLMLVGCMSFQSLKAPCDQYASGCGQKIRINV